jgi:hypothetical protein
MITMAKRRKRSPSKTSEDDEDYELEKVDKKHKSKGRRRSSKARGVPEVNKGREALMIFGLAAILIAATVGWYIVDADILNLEDDDDDEIVIQEPVYGVKLEVISYETHQFGTSSVHKAHPNENTQYMLLLTNTGNNVDTINLQLSPAPAGWGYLLIAHEDKLDSSNNIRIPAGGAEVLILTVNVPGSGSISTQLTAYSTKDTTQMSTIDARTQVQDGGFGEKTAERRDPVKVYYTLVDRGTDGDYKPNKWAWNQANEFPFTIGEGVIEGFSYMAEGMREGETKVEILPTDLCYGNSQTDGKPDGPLAYEMTMLDIDTES